MPDPALPLRLLLPFLLQPGGGARIDVDDRHMVETVAVLFDGGIVVGAVHQVIQVSNLQNHAVSAILQVAHEIRKLAGLLLLMSESSAYLDAEQEPSLVEKISKLDELTKKLVTGSEPA